MLLANKRTWQQLQNRSSVKLNISELFFMHFQNINRTDSGCEKKGTLKYMPKWTSMLHVLRAQQKAKGHGDSEQGFSTSSRLTGSVTVRSCNIRAHFCWGFSMAFASPSSNWEQYSKTLPNYTVQFKRHGIDIAWLSVLSLKTMAAFVRHLKTEVKSMLFLDFLYCIMQLYLLLIHLNGFGLEASVVSDRPFEK